LQFRSGEEGGQKPSKKKTPPRRLFEFERGCDPFMLLIFVVGLPRCG
jgi:hypothetical protein